MPEDVYNRQEALGLSIPSCLTIAGLGGVGAWVAIDAAMSGVKHLFLFDPDIMEESNRNRLPFCQSSINKPKVQVVEEYILAIRPEITVIAVQEKLEGLLLKLQCQVCRSIIDCTDSPKAQREMYRAATQRSITYIRAGYDGTRIMVSSNVSGWIKVEEEENYTFAPSWVVPAQVVGALAVGKLLKYTNQEIGLDVSEIGIPALQRHKRLTKRCRQPAQAR